MTLGTAFEQYKQELRDHAAALVAARFGGDWEVAFGHYAADGAVTKPELEVLLADAGVRNAWNRWAWASAILAEQDVDADGRISWPEFATAFKVVKPARPSRNELRAKAVTGSKSGRGVGPVASTAGSRPAV